MVAGVSFFVVLADSAGQDLAQGPTSSPPFTPTLSPGLLLLDGQPYRDGSSQITSAATAKLNTSVPELI